MSVLWAWAVQVQISVWFWWEDKYKGETVLNPGDSVRPPLLPSSCFLDRYSYWCCSCWLR